MKNKKFKKILTLVIEPIALGVLALLFIIPTVTVMNLQPLTKALKEIDILGVSEKAEVKIEIVGGSHQIFSREKLQKDEEGIFRYTTEIANRDADRYSKPILEISNKKDTETVLEIYGYTHLPTKSNISLIINDQVYKLQGSNGDVITQSILILPQEKNLVYLAIESFSDVQFVEKFELEIKVIE